MPFWLPNGTVLWRLVEREVREQLAKRGYAEIKTPRVLDVELWHRSGHWDNYRENMYFVDPPEREGDERHYALKPMNCPGACLVFGSDRHSYRDLPLAARGVRRRLALRARGRPARPAAGARVHSGRRPRLLHARPGARRGRLDLRGDRRALRALRLRPGSRRALDASGEVDRHRRAVGARDRRPARGARAPAARRTTSARGRAPSTGRRSTSTSPMRSAAPGSSAPASSTSRCRRASSSPTRARTTPTTPPVMIHRALLGSMERFIGILIEHYGGRFPAWLAPVQAAILPVSDSVQRLRRVDPLPSLATPGVRVRVDDRTESVGRKIRDAELAKVPVHARRRRARAGRRRRVGALARAGRPRDGGRGRDPRARLGFVRPFKREIATRSGGNGPSRVDPKYVPVSAELDARRFPARTRHYHKMGS